MKKLKIGKLKLGGMPHVAASFNDRSPSSLIEEARRSGLDLAELRIDHFSQLNKSDVVLAIKRFRGLPVLATIRSKKEGGNWKRTESERLSLFQAMIPHVDAVDIELSSKTILRKVIRAAQQKKKVVIISYHNFRSTPSAAQLKNILFKAKSAGADIVKIAAFAKKESDLDTLARFTQAFAPLNLITISMGEKGAVSRIVFPGLGSLLTFSHFGKSTAPGQLDYRTTFQLLSKIYSHYRKSKSRFHLK